MFYHSKKILKKKTYFLKKKVQSQKTCMENYKN